VHKEIYLQTSHRAVVHAHPPKAVILSMSLDRIEPIDSEGKALLGSIKVLPDYPSGSLELARAVSEELKSFKACGGKGTWRLFRRQRSLRGLQSYFCFGKVLSYFAKLIPPKAYIPSPVQRCMGTL
jgi:hypothetical protein